MRHTACPYIVTKMPHASADGYGATATELCSIARHSIQSARDHGSNYIELWRCARTCAYPRWIAPARIPAECQCARDELGSKSKLGCTRWHRKLREKCKKKRTGLHSSDPRTTHAQRLPLQDEAFGRTTMRLRLHLLMWRNMGLSLKTAKKWPCDEVMSDDILS